MLQAMGSQRVRHDWVMEQQIGEIFPIQDTGLIFTNTKNFYKLTRRAPRKKMVKDKKETSSQKSNSQWSPRKKMVKDKKETSSQKSNSQWSVYPTNKQDTQEKCKLNYQGGITEHKPDLQNC